MIFQKEIKKRPFLVIIIWATSLIVFHFGISYQEKIIQDLPHKIELYSDKSQGGLSEIDLITKGDTINYWFELRQYEDSLSWTWGSMKILLDTFIDISDYDYLEFEIKNSKDNIQSFEIAVNYPDSSSLPFHSLSQYADISTEYSHIKLPISNFKTSTWWLTEKDIKEAMPYKVNYKEFLSFSIGEGKYTKHSVRENISLHSLKATKHILWPYYIFITILLFLLLLFFIDRLQIKREKKVTIKYATTPESPENDEPSVIDYLTSNYQNKELLLKDVSLALGISESKVSQQIKRETSQTFKELRNSLRIEKAKVLLIETDVRISEIAEQIGYENVTSFNRVFKKMTNESPSNYRALNNEK